MPSGRPMEFSIPASLSSLVFSVLALYAPIVNWLTLHPPLTECARSAQCINQKHHFDECAERVTRQHENPDHKGPKEDCLEECEWRDLPISLRARRN